MSGGIFYLLAEIIFGFTIIASLGMFGYQKLLETQIGKMQGDLTTATENIEPDLIHQLSKASTRFQSAQEIINKHVTISRLFDLLESLTLQTVRFNDFAYSTDQGGAISITMSGEARSYATVALQADIFSKDGSFKSSQFSNLDLNSKGSVVFNFKGRLNPSVISYTKGLQKVTPETQAEVTAPVVSPSTEDTLVGTSTSSSAPATTTSSKTKKP